MENTRELLDEKIVELMNEISELKPGSEEQLRLVKAVAELERVQIEDFRSQAEAYDKQERLELEREKFEKENAVEILSTKDRIINWVSDIKGDTVINAYVVVKTLKMALKFEANDGIYKSALTKFSEMQIPRILRK